jgi:hypothetical protein
MVMKSKNKLIMCLAALLFFAFLSGSLQAADVDVTAEGIFTSQEFEVCVFADINDKPLISFGVLVSYDDAILSVNDATKAENVWYFGDGTTNYPYMDPETGKPGDVVIIGGKLDEGDPTEGVDGLGVPLGRVKFDRSESSIPLATTITLDYGRGLGDYKNFVATDGEVKDGPQPTGVSFATVPIYRKGDVSKDGNLTNDDIFAVKDEINAGRYSCLADCNGDGNLTNDDIFCVKDEINDPS